MRLPGLFFIVYSVLSPVGLNAQVLIHASDNNEQRHPLQDAIRQKANSIQADVIPVHGRLMVAGDKDHIVSSRTLDALYLEPIVRDFAKHGDRTVSSDPNYTFYLMVRIGEKCDSVLPVLMGLLKEHPRCFDRAVNPMAVQVFVSGETPADTTFHLYPPEIMFDGLPGINYRVADAKKVIMISTGFRYYSDWDGKGKFPGQEAERLRGVITDAHRMGKPVRFWDAPDTRDCWKTLISLGANVISTTHVKTCRKFLNPKGR
jgi:alkaline phosphatase